MTKIKNNELFTEKLPWVDQWIEESVNLTIFNSEEKNILKQLRLQWNKSDRINLLDRLRDDHGIIVEDILRKLIKEVSIRDWKYIGQNKENNSLKDFIKVLWDPEKMEGFNFDITEDSGHYSIRCTKCPMAELAKNIGGREWIFIFTCYSDKYMAKGFNSSIRFERSKTLVTEDDHCNHSYYLVD